jgi:hypothetical protein
VQFILKSRAFLLEFADYRLHQCLWHRASLSPAFGRQEVPTEDAGPSCRVSPPHGLASFSISKADESRCETDRGQSFDGVIRIEGKMLHPLPWDLGNEWARWRGGESKAAR